MFGIKSNTGLSSQEIENFRKLAVYSTFRGKESTGVAAICKKKKKFHTHLLKDVLSPANFVESDAFNDKMKLQDIRMLVGHNRWATKGHVCYENAHPFWVGEIIGAHNGTIDKLAPKDGKGTDSEQLFKLIDEFGIKEAVKEAQHGAYALTFIDRKAGTFNMCRNHQRTLFITTNDKTKTMMWASTREILRHVIEETFFPGDWAAPVLLEVDKLFVFRMEHMEPVDIVDIKPEPYWRQHHVPVVTRPPEKDDEAVHAFTDDIPFSDDLVKVEENIRKRQMTPAEVCEKHNKEIEAYRGFEHKIIPIEKVTHLLQEGCQSCGSIMGLHRKIWWFSPRNYVCKECEEKEYTRTTIVPRNGYVYEGIYMTKKSDINLMNRKTRYIT